MKYSSEHQNLNSRSSRHAKPRSFKKNNYTEHTKNKSDYLLCLALPLSLVFQRASALLNQMTKLLSDQAKNPASFLLEGLTKGSTYYY